MTVEEIFGQIATHMIEGLMFHSQMSEYYEFLGLPGYSECHKYHYFCESWSFQNLCLYFIEEFNKLLPVGQANDPSVIPNSWYKYKREDVDTNTKRNSVKTGIEKWVAWERDTKKLYEQMYGALLEINEMAAAHKVKELVKDVDEELKCAEQYHLNKKAIDYDIVAIIEEQEKKKDKYCIKVRELYLHK